MMSKLVEEKPDALAPAIDALEPHYDMDFMETNNGLMKPISIF